MSQVFVSYRHVEPDEGLAERLCVYLEERGLQVFLDKRIPTGLLWAREIDSQLRASSFFVVFLSEESVRSDMVRQETETAHQLRLQGRMVILPVRVDFEKALPYDLASYLNPIQYSLWRSGESVEGLCAQIHAAITGGAQSVKSEESGLTGAPLPAAWQSGDESLLARPNALSRPEVRRSVYLAPQSFSQMYSLEEIVKEYDQIDLSIQVNAYREALNALEPSMIDGYSIVLGDRSFRHSRGGEFLDCSLRINIFKQPGEVRRGSNIISKSRPLKEAGFVRKVTVSVPAELKAKAEKLLQCAVTSLRRGYVNLEMAFLDGYRKMADDLVLGLDEIMRNEYRAQMGQDVPGNCSLSVTPPKSRKYAYMLSYETVRDRLDRLKETDLQGFSPLLAAIILITGEATDSFVENGLVTQDRFSMLPFDKMASKLDNPSLWGIERVLYGKNLAMREICQVYGYSLQSNITVGDSRGIEKFIDSVQVKMREQFRQNLDQYIKRRALLCIWAKESKWRKE
ncbi:MAG TPA: toll/interleukin-1 receptor domain-containing protein [Thermoanaerobaculia bacterium]|nr:toll/interleukin-1 receptor domain-containing protein [Thermoanaerobaculia bacterium]